VRQLRALAVGCDRAAAVFVSADNERAKRALVAGLRAAFEREPTPHEVRVEAFVRAAQESEIPNFEGSDLGHFPLVSADFWTSDHLSERS
jgi:hypothetical protein